MATLAEVARTAGVSLATASRVLSGSGYRVRPELRRRVLAAARSLNYVPNAHAQALVRARTHVVGVVAHDVSDPYFAEIVRGAQRVASRAGRLTIICNTYRDPDREVEYVRLLHAQRVEAIVLAGSGRDDRSYGQKMLAAVEAYLATGGRLVVISRHHLPGDAVLPDNFGGARALAHYLADLGHRRVAMIAGPPQLTTTRDRVEGFRQGLSEKGIRLDPTWVLPGDFSRDSGEAAAEQLLRRGLRVTAIFALNDQMAVGALATLRRAGFRVPDDVSLAGFDDMAIARDVTPTLTTVRIPMEEMGVRAMELALESPGEDLRVAFFPAVVIPRESTAPPKGA
ncbi:MAG: LacI family DNA-binding transcriptional regulator [Armatimonadota bacterium]|nr:LacI family DNA-binding transcriptional regulator [Armatimonadota bacterium]MDR5688797.1 LacI family DNA-binding transcriptional regulator [Armatimonadota bacterium]MDR7387378.1 LacI family DNA-binding transcriptional regulator [Armatimonadota bacterium]MDR7388686.1 LacI family DNA-binding transcriptional regulator [Armatimonadota bacterium]MDR7391126.1 LacI family DNA-binding transcriptional regulator [Armatimonadota bacterium]